MNTAVDLGFPITAGSIPVDHGYALYAALSRVVPGLHGARWLGVHPISGTPSGDETLELRDDARLLLRLPAERIADVLPLAGKTLDIAGARVTVGAPTVNALVRVRPPRPSASLHDGVASAVIAAHAASRARRRCHPRQPWRKKGDNAKNAKIATMLVIYTLRRVGTRRLEGPINVRHYASFAPKRRLTVGCDRSLESLRAKPTGWRWSAGVGRMTKRPCSIARWTAASRQVDHRRHRNAQVLELRCTHCERASS